MPKTYITTQDKLNNKLSAWIVWTMKSLGYSQESVAKELGISQQALSRKIHNRKFTYEELVSVFGILKPDSETVADLMGVNTWMKKE